MLVDSVQQQLQQPQKDSAALSVSLAKDLQSRKTLTALLDEQIDRNQLLQSQNLMLEEEQRKLLVVLEERTGQIQRLRENALLTRQTESKDETMMQQQARVGSRIKANDDTTLEATMINLGNSNLISADPSEHAHMMKKLILINQQLKNQIKEKEHEVSQFQEKLSKLKDYYIRVIESMEAEPNSCKQQLQLKYTTQIQQLSKSYENSLAKQRSNFQEMSKRIVQLEEKQHQLQMLETILKEKDTKLKRFEKNQNKLIQKISQLEDELKGLIQIQQNKQQEINQELRRCGQGYQKQILTLQQTIQMNQAKHLKQLAQSKEIILKQTKACLIQELQKQQQSAITAKKQLQKQLLEMKKAHKSALVKNEEQLEAMILLEERSTELSRKQQIMKRECQQKDMEIERLMKIETNLTDNSEQLKKTIKELSGELKVKVKELAELQQTGKSDTQQLTKQLSKCQQKNAILAQELLSLKSEHAELKEQYKGILQQTQSNALTVETLKQKLQKEKSRKQKITAEFKNTFKEFESEIDQITEKNTELQTQLHSLQEEKLEQLKKLSKELNMVKDKYQKSEKEKSEIKSEVKNIEIQMSQMLETYEKKQRQLDLKVQTLSKSMKQMALQKQHVKKMNEQLKEGNHRLKKEIQQQYRKNQQLVQTISICQQQINSFKEEILNIQLSSSQKEELAKLRDEHYRIKAQISYQNEQKNKHTQQIEELTKDLIQLSQINGQLKGSFEEEKSKSREAKEQLEKAQVRNKQLQKSLRERCSQLDSSTPYLNQVIEQKRIIQNEHSKLLNDLRKKDSLLQTAKHAKVNEIMKMKQEIEHLSKKLSSQQAEYQDAKEMCQKFNRQKVHILRESTNKGDEIKKLATQNKLYKEEIEKMKDINQQLQEQLDGVYKIMQQQQQEQQEKW